MKRSDQVFEGDEARNFDDYFSLTKEKATLKRAQAVSASATASGADSSGSKHTHGYLYYCTPSQDRPPLSGSFRFPVLPSTLKTLRKAPTYSDTTDDLGNYNFAVLSIHQDSHPLFEKY